MYLRPSPRIRYVREIALFLYVRPIVYTNLSRKRSLQKRSLSQRNFKRPALRFIVEGKHFENGAGRKTAVTIIM